MLERRSDYAVSNDLSAIIAQTLTRLASIGIQLRIIEQASISENSCIFVLQISHRIVFMTYYVNAGPGVDGMPMLRFWPTGEAEPWLISEVGARDHDELLWNLLPSELRSIA